MKDAEENNCPTFPKFYTQRHKFAHLLQNIHMNLLICDTKEAIHFKN
jgi:hypothetical protein